ncbi:hypothetical protein SRHO_G00093400 [Serrasalmus rhombeus]
MIQVTQHDVLIRRNPALQQKQPIILLIAPRAECYCGVAAATRYKRPFEMLPCTELPLLKHLEHWSMCMCGGEIERQKENRRSVGFDSLDNGKSGHEFCTKMFDVILICSRAR